jgi:hypothetical protein
MVSVCYWERNRSRDRTPGQLDDDGDDGDGDADERMLSPLSIGAPSQKKDPACLM